MKKNPWNIKMQVDFDINHKESILKWYNEVLKKKNIKNQFKKESERERFLKENKLDSDSLKYLEDFYNSGYGFKIIAKCLGLSYTKTRNLLINYLNLKTRTGKNVVTEKLKKFRSERVSGNKSPWYNWPEKGYNIIDNSNTGIQGYYKRKNGKYIWLRSTWEYVYCKWLDYNNIIWDPIYKSFKLSNGESYLPDFKIIQNNIEYIVEVKGSRFKLRLYKIKMLKKEYNVNIIIIDDLNPYLLNTTYIKELNEWKNIKLSKKELKKLTS